MITPPYVIIQEFLKIEAIGTWGANTGQPTDPIRINAYVTPSDSLATTIESRDTNQIADKDALYRVANGRWALKLDPTKYTVGVAYTANFRFWATPDNVNVQRQNFVWDPVPDLPRNAGHCVVFGTLKDVSGLLIADAQLIVERYKNFVTLNEREAQSTIKTNVFGLWTIELPIASVTRFVFGNISKVIKVPDTARISLFEIPEYQPVSSTHDKFGYPFPGGV